VSTVPGAMWNTDVSIVTVANWITVVSIVLDLNLKHKNFLKCRRMYVAKDLSKFFPFCGRFRRFFQRSFKITLTLDSEHTRL
jgi:hypothetical protein